jgi:hypothetical protein
MLESLPAVAWKTVEYTADILTLLRLVKDLVKLTPLDNLTGLELL